MCWLPELVFTNVFVFVSLVPLEIILRSFSADSSASRILEIKSGLTYSFITTKLVLPNTISSDYAIFSIEARFAISTLLLEFEDFFDRDRESLFEASLYSMKASLSRLAVSSDMSWISCLLLGLSLTMAASASTIVD